MKQQQILFGVHPTEQQQQQQQQQKQGEGTERFLTLCPIIHQVCFAALSAT